VQGKIKQAYLAQAGSKTLTCWQRNRATLHGACYSHVEKLHPYLVAEAPGGGLAGTLLKAGDGKHLHAEVRSKADTKREVIYIYFYSTSKYIYTRVVDAQ
jgi:hypothetical protein